MTDQNNAAQALPDFNSPEVQTVYGALCGTEQPPAGEHWDGWVSRHIVLALSKLRAERVQAGAPVADERAAFEAAMQMRGQNIYRWPNPHGGYRNSTTEMAWYAWSDRAALASASVAPAEVTDALNNVDDFIARCDGNDRGSCESVNILRRALASAPVAGEAQPTDAEVMKVYAETVAEYADGRGFEAGTVAFARSLLRRYAAPQASEAVRDADHPVFAFLLGEGPLRGVHFGDRHPDERGAYWWRKDLRAALSCPAQTSKDGGGGE